MSPAIRLAGAGVLVLAVVGAALLLMRPASTIGPSVPSSSLVSPTAPPTPGTTPAGTPLPTPLPIRETDAGRTLGAGRYHVPFFAAPFTVTLDGGWTVADAMPNNVVFRNGNTFLTLVVVNAVYRDPCHLESGTAPVEPGVDGLLTALSSMTGFEVTSVTDAIVDAAEGKKFTLGNAVDLSTANCTSPEVLAIGTFDDHGTNVDVLFGANAAEPLWALSVPPRGSITGATVLVGATPATIDLISFDATGLDHIDP